MTEDSRTYRVRIAAGCVVTYYDERGDERAAIVERVDQERGLVESRGVPGVLRLEDISSVGVYGDEAEFHLDPDGTDGDRITCREDNQGEEK